MVGVMMKSELSGKDLMEKHDSLFFIFVLSQCKYNGVLTSNFVSNLNQESVHPL